MSLRLAATVAVLGAMVPCGGKLGVRTPDLSSSRGLANTARAVGQAGAEAQKKSKECEKLGQLKVAIEEEKAIGGAVALNWVSKGGGLLLDVPKGKDLKALSDKAKVVPVENAKTALNRYVNRVGQLVAAHSSRPDLPWTFGVIMDESVNAYSAPGGYVLVTRGLLKLIDSEAQLAGVLAHEIGHITERHALKLYTQVKENQCKAQVATQLVGDNVKLTGGFAQALTAGNGFVDLNKMGAEFMKNMTNDLMDKLTSSGFAHQDEYAADRTGLDMVIAAGYNPYEYIQFLNKIPEGGGFAHHPKNKDRQAALDKWIAGIKPGADSFAYPDWPFKDYPAVPLKKAELAAIE